jgi:hypothetical protein
MLKSVVQITQNGITGLLQKIADEKAIVDTYRSLVDAESIYY